MATISLWNAPPQDFLVDPLVAILKSTSRWSHDGRSLRAVSRQWCAAISRHVFKIDPHPKRAIVVQDIHSLTKFPNLTELNTTCFERTGNTLDNPELLLRCLSKLGSLHRLTVDRLIEHCPNRRIRQLKGITSLKLLNDRAGLSKMSRLSIEELSGKFLGRQLIDWIPKMTTLKTLDVEWNGRGAVDRSLKFVESVRRLESVRLKDRWCETLNDLQRMQNLVSLEVIEDHDIHPSFFLDLPRLKELRWFFKYASFLESEAFPELVKRLTSLDMTFVPEIDNGCEMPEHVMHGLTRLERLRLSDIQLLPTTFDDILGNHLTRLELDCNDRATSLTFDGKPKSLKHLTVDAMCFYRSDIALDISCMTNLTRLSISLRGVFREIDLSTQLRCLKHLESLKLQDTWCDWNWLIEFFDFVDHLPKLTELSIGKSIYIHDLIQLLESDKLMNLKVVTVLMEKYTPDAARLKSPVQMFKKRAPYLLLDISMDGHRIDSESFTST